MRTCLLLNMVRSYIFSLCISVTSPGNRGQSGLSSSEIFFVPSVITKTPLYEDDLMHRCELASLQFP